MRWRPGLAALAALGLVAGLLGAMSSASSPSVGPAREPEPAGEEVAPPQEANEVRPAEAQVTSPEFGIDPAALPDDPVVDPDGDGGLIDPIEFSAFVDPGGFDVCIPGNPFCDVRLIEEEEHEELSEAEVERIQQIPTGASYSGEPLGRPARKIRRGPAGDPGEPRLYLTFDDGPSPTWTRPTLDLLDRYSARATFFPVGAYAELNFGLIEEIVARGHTIGTHLWSHQERALYDEDWFRQEVRASAELFGDSLTNCLRTPYGITNEQIFEWAGEEGFEIVLWGDVDPLDWRDPGIQVLTRRILSGVRPGTILLLHERTGGDTLQALDAVLAALTEAGWRFDQPICPLQF